jgi:tetratricopeptide (TPR) repeat protein
MDMEKRNSGSRRRYVFFPVIVLSACLYLLLPSVIHVYAQDGDRDRASTLYREAVEFFDNGDVSNAIETINNALKANPDYPEAYDSLGYMLIQTGDFDGALSAFQSALERNPALRTSKSGLGFALLAKGDMKEAESKFMEALTLNPYPSMAHYGLGLVYEGLKEYENAVEHFKKGIRKHKSRK